MKKVLATGFICAFISSSYAQVGINTESPSATLDVSAKRDSGGAITDNTQLYGLQAPRLTRAELTANTATYAANQKGALIYITDVSGGTTGGQRVNIDAIGYYYFDGSFWQKVLSSVTNDWHSAGNSDAEISTSSETLGSAPASTNYLGTVGTSDNLVIVTGNKTHAVVNTSGALSGGGETTSSLYWGYNNPVVTGSQNFASPTHTTPAASVTATGVVTVAASNVVLGRDNKAGAASSNTPVIAIGKNNSVFKGGVAIGTDNYAGTAFSFAFGRGNTIYSDTSGGGYFIGIQNEGSGYAFGSGTKTADSSYAFGGTATAAQAQASAANAMYLGAQGGLAKGNTTLYSNTSHVFANSTDGAGVPTTATPAKVGINVDVTTSTADADLQVSKAVFIKAGGASTTGSLPPTATCNAANAGTIVYVDNSSNSTSSFWGCSKTAITPSIAYGWQRLNN